MARAESEQADRLSVLGDLVETYERARFPIAEPSPAEAIRFRIEQQGTSPRICAKLLPMARKSSKRRSSKQLVCNGLDAAETILQQMGGAHRLKAMIGAYDFMGSETGLIELMFKWKAKAKNGANGLRIILDPSDTYMMYFYKLRAGKATGLKVFEDIYADQLREIFEDYTGLRLRM